MDRMMIQGRPWAIWAVAAFDLAFALCAVVWTQVVDLAARDVCPCGAAAHRGAIGGTVIAFLVAHLVVAPGFVLLRPWAYRARLGLLGGQAAIAAGLAVAIPLPWLVAPLAGALAAIAVVLAWPGTRSAFLGGPPRDPLPPILDGALAWGLGLLAMGLAALGVSSGSQGHFVTVHGTANESATLGDVRAFAAAEAAFADRHSGTFATPACLVDPAGCGGVGEAPYLDATILSSSKSGYRRSFHHDAGAHALTAVPAERGRTGCRSFCTDTTGTICATYGELSVRDGRCDPTTCTALP
jgi:hypothetical protein